MVDKADIEIIITKSIDIVNKCSRLAGGVKSSLNNQIRHSLYQFYDKTKKLKYENVCYMNNKGKQLFKKKGDATSWKVTQNELNKMLTKNYDYLVNGGRFDITHNHPGPYANTDLDNKDFTCLSVKDMNNLTLPFYIEGEYSGHYVRSITADSSNGTRMTLLHNNPDDEIDKEKYDKTAQNLVDNWTKYILDSEDNTKEKLLEFTEDWQDNHNGKLPSAKVLHDAKIKIQDDFAKSNFEGYINDNIKDFKELGFELSYEWIN